MARTSLRQRLTRHARHRWPQLAGIAVRYCSGFACIDALLPNGEQVKLCRLQYAGSAHDWGFAIYRASHHDYDPSCLPAGMMGGPAEDAFDTACSLYLARPATNSTPDELTVVTTGWVTP